MEADAVQAMRDTLRKRARDDRKSLTFENRARLSGRICAHIQQWEGYCAADVLLGYVPMGTELLLLPLFQAALKEKRRLFLPKTGQDFSLDFYEVFDLAHLQNGPMGTREPEGGTLYRPSLGGLCIVPGLCFDRQGGRLGYGKGCYDRFLRDFSGIKAAPVYEAAVFDCVATCAHDVPMDFLITELGVLSCLTDGRE